MTRMGANTLMNAAAVAGPKKVETIRGWLAATCGGTAADAGQRSLPALSQAM